MKQQLLTFLVILSLFTIGAVAQGPGMEGIPLDDDGDGIANFEDPDFEKTYPNQANMIDADGDGVPNNQDEDYRGEGYGNMGEFQAKMTEVKSANKGSMMQEGMARGGISGTVEGLKMMNQYTNSSFGKQVSEFAQKYEANNQKSLEYAEKLESRNTVSRFFMGGDKDTAIALKEQVGINNEEILALRAEMIDASPEEVEVIQTQIDKLQEECDRLGEVADKEISRKGLFKWW